MRISNLPHSVAEQASWVEIAQVLDWTALQINLEQQQAKDGKNGDLQSIW